MNLLRDILRVVAAKSDLKKSLPEMMEEGDTRSISARFVQGVYNGDFSDDEQAANSLYGQGRQDQRYRTLKSRLLERLLNALLTLQIKQPEHSEYLTTYYKVMRNSIAAQTLVRFSARAAGTFVAERTLSSAEKYQFTDICISLLIILRESAGMRQNRREFYDLNQKLETYIAVLAAECKSEFFLDSFTFETRRTKVSIAELAVQASSYCAEIDKILDQHDTHLIRLNSYRMKVLAAEVMRDSKQGVAVTEEALDYIRAHPRFFQPARVGEFSSSKMYFCVTLKQFEAALTMADDCLSTFATGGFNWYNAVDLAFVAAMNIGQYERATAYYKSATEHPRFSVQSEAFVERFKVHAAYLFMLSKLGLYYEAETINKPFRLSTYLNSVPEFSKDKKGSNCTVLISHVLLLVLTKQYDLVEKRLDYLKVYTGRYLREHEFTRTRLFIKLLALLPQCSFDPARIRRQSGKLLEQLQDSYTEIALPEVVEVLRYELLFDRLVTVMEGDID